MATGILVDEEVGQPSSFPSTPLETTSKIEDERKLKGTFSSGKHRTRSNGDIKNDNKDDNISDDAVNPKLEMGNDSRSSLTGRVLPNRPSHEVARDTKRILEICYGGKKQQDTASAVVGSGVLTNPMPTEEGIEGINGTAVKTEKKKKKTTKNGKKKSRRKSCCDSVDDIGSKSGDNEKVDGVPEKVESSKSATKSGTTKKKRRKGKKKTKTAENIVTRDAAGKIVRKRRKIKGRHRVVRKQFIKKGKDAKMELPIISEDYNGEEDSDDESDGEHDDESYVSISDHSDEEGESDDAECSFYETVDGSGDDKDREVENVLREKNEVFEEQDITGIDGTKRDDDVLPVTEERPIPPLEKVPDSDVSNNDDVAILINEPSVDQAIEILVVDVTPATADFDVEAHILGAQRSVASIDSTACTSTAREENRRERKSVLLFGSSRNLVCAAMMFVVIVTSITILVVYILSLQARNNEYSTLAPSFKPTDVPHLGEHPALRASLPPTYAPTSLPTAIYSTSSTSCQRPDQKPGVQIQEAEYAPEHFGNATIEDVKSGYCGEGYVTNLTRYGSGFEFLPFNVDTTGYYRVAVRYNNADETGKSLVLLINDLEEDTFDLVPTGNESTWMVQGIDNILLRPGNYVLRVSVQSDDKHGPSIDWLSLSFQESVSRFDYLNDLLESHTNVTIPSQSQSAAIEWMSSQDPTDWSTLTNQEIIERYALVQIYYSTTGDAWFNSNQWLSEFHACSWYGIACSKDNLVTDLMLDNNGLVGLIPTDLSLLTNLILISMDTNSLEGTIPSQIEKLEKLSKLFLHANFLTGLLPSEFGALTDLKTVDLRANNLIGPIPEEMYSMVGLESLALSSNALGGTLSTNIGMLTAMLHLDLQSDQLSGKIPSELGKLKLLSSLSLGYNAFSGSIPSELGLLLNLSILDISSNQLTGTLPLEINFLKDTIIDYYGNNILQ